jgi:hypothetical protein
MPSIGLSGATGASEPKASDGSLVEQRTEGVGVAGAVAPHVVGGGPIGEQMDRLHGGDEVVPRQPGQIVGVDDLDVFDAVRQGQSGGCIGRLPFAQHVNHLAHGPVADGVDGHGKTGRRGLGGDLPQLFGRGDNHAGVGRFALERGQHGSRA